MYLFSEHTNRITRHILHCIFCVCCERLDWQNVIIFTFDVWVLVYHKLGCPVLAPFGTMLQCYVDMIFAKRLSAFFHIKTNKKTSIMIHRNHIFSSLFKNRYHIIYYLVYLNNKYILPLLSIIIYYIPSKYITILMGIILHKNVNLMNFLFKLF